MKRTSVVVLLPVTLGLALAEAPVPQMKESTVLVLVINQVAGTDKGSSGNGSGFMVDDRHAVTNWHVCCMAEAERQGPRIVTTIGVASSADNVVKAKVLWSSMAKDLAVLELEKDFGKPAVTFATRSQLRDGQPVFAIGYPGAASRISDDADKFIPTLTQGIIGKFFAGKVRSNLPSVQLIQTTAAVNPGNSGGPLFDECGNVVGINRAKALTFVVTPDARVVRVPEADGINWSVQTDELLPELTRLGVSFRTAPEPCAAGGLEGREGRRTSQWMIAAQVGTVVLAALALLVAFNRRARESVSRLTTRRSTGAKRDERRHAPTPGPAPPVPAQPLRPHLKGISGFYTGSKVALGGESWVLGRDPHAANIVFPGDMSHISKRHCIVRFDTASQRVYLEDAWSSNGTFLSDGKQMKSGSTVELRAGDRFYLGNKENMFEITMEPGS